MAHVVQMPCPRMTAILVWLFLEGFLCGLLPLTSVRIYLCVKNTAPVGRFFLGGQLRALRVSRSPCLKELTPELILGWHWQARKQNDNFFFRGWAWWDETTYPLSTPLLETTGPKRFSLSFNSVFFPVLAELSFREREQRVSREKFLLRGLGPLGFDYISTE